MSVMKKTFILLFLLMELTAVDLMAQLPPQTVVFKVRKDQRETIKIAVITEQTIYYC